MRDWFEWRRRLRQTAPLMAVIATVAVVVGYYAFQVSAGGSGEWHAYTDYYDRLAGGFASGHLYVSTPASPALLRARNPFDPVYRPLWLWDASLYRGHIYLYWGPVPGAIGAVLKLWKPSITVGDEALTFCFMVGRLLGGAGVLWLLSRRLVFRPPLWSVLVAIVAFGVVSPTPFFLARSAVYEAAIAGGQCFLSLGWLFAILALSSKHRTAWLVLASSMWGLALGCRVSLLPGALATALVTFVAANDLRDVRWRPTAVTALALGVPLASALAGLAAYNYARFDDAFEFGTKHQMSWMKFWTDRSFILSNVHEYLLRPFETRCQFPYFTAPWDLGTKSLPQWLRPGRGYVVGEPVAGMLVTTPFVWLSLALPLPAERRASLVRRWAVVIFILTAVLGIAPALGLWIATMRYLSDVSAAMVLLGALGGFHLLRRMRNTKLYPVGVAAYSISAAASIVIGVSLGFQGYADHFQTNNPALIRELSRSLSVCHALSRWRETPGVFAGNRPSAR